QPCPGNTEKSLIAFDHMFAINKNGPTGDPEFRPESLFDTIGWMQRNGLDNVPYPGHPNAYIQYKTSPAHNNFGVLRPTIEHVIIEEPVGAGAKDAYVTLYGTFGSGQAAQKVEFDSTTLSILQWTPTKIMCTAPANNPKYGMIVVTADGHKSNEVPITYYDVPFTYTMKGAGSLFWKWEMHMHYRLDVHK